MTERRVPPFSAIELRIQAVQALHAQFPDQIRLLLAVGAYRTYAIQAATDEVLSEETRRDRIRNALMEDAFINPYDSDAADRELGVLEAGYSAGREIFDKWLVVRSEN